MIKIISDSTCDLSKELIEKYDIAISPLHIHLGNDEYEDGINISPDEIYKWSDINKDTPKTSAPSITEVVNLYEKYPEDELIVFSISESMSTTVNVMRLAAVELEREDDIHVIDSKNLSTGIGLLVIEAATMAKEGKSAVEIIEVIEALIPRVRASFVVDTLTYLHRGGRCSGVVALAGSALKLHPLISVESGNMVAGKKYRGTMKRVIMSYVKDNEMELSNARPNRIFLTHSGCDEEIVREVHNYLEDLGYFAEILETRAGSVICSHCGPGTLGILYILNE